jgi:putative transposase
MSDHKGATLILDVLPEAKELLADRGYDSDKFRAALIERGVTPCIPPRKNRKVQHHYCKTFYKRRHKIENIFGRLKNWRRIAMRYDCCAHTFLSSINIAATIIFWINQ